MPSDWLERLDIEVHRLVREAFERAHKRIASLQEGRDYPADEDLRCAA